MPAKHINMCKIPLLLSVLFVSVLGHGQRPTQNDTSIKRFIIDFTKVNRGNTGALATMQLAYNEQNQQANIDFYVPAIWYRVNTSLTDYCIIKTKSTEIKLVNTVEHNMRQEGDNFMYRFSFTANKDTLQQFFANEISTVSVFFTPTETVAKKYQEVEGKLPSLDKYMIKLSRMTLENKVSKPNKQQAEYLKNWVQKL